MRESRTSSQQYLLAFSEIYSEDLFDYYSLS